MGRELALEEASKRMGLVEAQHIDLKTRRWGSSIARHCVWFVRLLGRRVRTFQILDDCQQIALPEDREMVSHGGHWEAYGAKFEVGAKADVQDAIPGLHEGFLEMAA